MNCQKGQERLAWATSALTARIVPFVFVGAGLDPARQQQDEHKEKGGESEPRCRFAANILSLFSLPARATARVAPTGKRNDLCRRGGYQPPAEWRRKTAGRRRFAFAARCDMIEKKAGGI